MKEQDLLSVQQIHLAQEFVDSQVERAVRAFHLEAISPATSPFETWFSTPSLDAESLSHFELTETRFSHLTQSLPLPQKAPLRVGRQSSLIQGTPHHTVNSDTLCAIVQNAFGADTQRRRPYPSGGALYTVECLVITGPYVTGLKPLSVLHYLPVSHAFELLQESLILKEYEGITDLSGVSFYLLYCINLKKSIFKYRYRGYRLSILEAGSMYQQALLEAEHFGLSSRVIAGFSEGSMAHLCGINASLMLPTIIQAFGLEQRDP